MTKFSSLLGDRLSFQEIADILKADGYRGLSAITGLSAGTCQNKVSALRRLGYRLSVLNHSFRAMEGHTVNVKPHRNEYKRIF